MQKPQIFINLCYHKADFGIHAEWHFYVTLHGKGSCVGVGGTIKRLETIFSNGNSVSAATAFYSLEIPEIFLVSIFSSDRGVKECGCHVPEIIRAFSNLPCRCANSFSYSSEEQECCSGILEALQSCN